MKTRITNPAVSVAGAMEALQALGDAVGKSGVPHSTVHLVGMRASQINGCGVCLDGAWRFQKAAGETDGRLFALAGWREAPYYSDAERAALALAEAVTRLADRPDPVRIAGGRSGPALRRVPAVRPRDCDRRDRCLGPHQRDHPADNRRLGR